MKLSTPPGTAGVAVVRVELQERATVLASLRTAGGTPCVPRAGAPRRALLRVDGRDLDDVLVVARADGELELHLHGAPAVLAALRAHFGLEPAAPASAAAALLRRALSTAQLDLALEQQAYDFDRELASIARLAAPARGVARAAALARSRVALALTTPQRVVLAGRQNAGKSTLFNALVARERVLAGPMPGLTRDPVAEVTTLGGYPYELVDTAGEGAVPGDVDAAALARGRALRASALVVLVVDGSSGPDAVDRALARDAALVVAAKGDLAPAPWPADVRRDATVSAATRSLTTLRATFAELLRAHRGLPPAGAVGGFAALDAAGSAALAALAD